MALASGAVAQVNEPAVLKGASLFILSPNGRYAVSPSYEALTIYDLESGKSYLYGPDDLDYTVSYGCGNGNCVSDNGIVVGYTSTNSDAAYWQDGEWHQLPVSEGLGSVTLGGINREGTVICGFAYKPGVDPYGEEIMMYPYIWEKGSDGKWSAEKALPYPKVDFTGRAPQYISALCVSDDGNTVAGQLRDYSGSCIIPVRYTRDSKGEWSYALVHDELLNPNKLEFPEWPGASPNMPQMEDFLGDDSKKAYDDAYAQWLADCTASGNWDYSIMPTVDQYMTVSEATAYNKASEEYNALAEVYNTKLMAFNEVFVQCLKDNTTFLFNNLYMTGDGKHVSATSEVAVQLDPDDEWSTVSVYKPYVFNLEDDSFTNEEDSQLSLTVTSMAADGTLLAVSDEELPNAYIKCPGKDWQQLTDYMLATTPETGKWMQENMYHTFDLMDWFTNESTHYENAPVIGSPICTADLSLIATATEKIWTDDEDDDVYDYSYLLPNDGVNGVRGIAADGGSFTLKASRGGIVSVQGDAVALSVYDMQGRLVFSLEPASGDVATGLDAGIYTVKAQGASGVKTVKVLF